MEIRVYTFKNLRGVSSVRESVNFDLLGSPWIYTVQKDGWDNALLKSTVCLYKKKDFIIQSGEIIECLYYLKKGRIKTVAVSPSGQQKIMWYINASCIFGETPFFNQKPCDYNFVAVTDCEIHILSKDILFQEVIPKYPELVISLLTTMSLKIHILSTQVEDLAFNKPIIRVAKLLYQFYQGNNLKIKKGTAVIPITQEDIAGILGIHRVTVNQIIRYLKEIQALEDNTHLIIVKNIKKLQEVFSQLS